MNTVLLETINRTCEANVQYGAAPQELISTGIPQLDAVIGGGIPKGRIIEIYGSDGSGKTALALQLSQQTGGPVLYADADHGLSPYILNRRDLYLLNVETLEDALGACKTAATGGFGAVVIDTVAAFPTREDMRCSINGEVPPRNLQAKVMAKCLPILSNLLHITGCTLILVNQLRERPCILSGQRACPTGGRAVGYFSALRLETCRYEDIKAADVVAGQKVLIRVGKCKYAVSGERAVVSLLYGKGVRR